MKRFSKKALVLGVMLTVGAAAQAAYLGQLQVTSQATQNFQATFLVHDVSPAGTSLTARLAPAATYAKYGINMPETAKNLNLALINKSPLTLRISSNRPAAERAFPLLVELNEGGHITVRQYNIHIGATGSVEPVEVVAMGAAPITNATPVAQKAPVKTTSKAEAAKPATVAKPASTEMSPLERMQSKRYDLSKPVLIEAGYTPWSLGVLYQKRYPNASVNQVLVALAVHNPEAFPAGNVRQLKAGAKVSAPPASLVESINAQTAREIVQKGLSIEEIAKRPAPIQTAKREAPKHKKPLPSIQTAPVKHLPVTKEDIESDIQKATPVPTEPVKTPAAVQTPMSDKVLAQGEAAHQEDTAVEQPPVIEKNAQPAESSAPEAVEEQVSPQEAMPTLEIMTEEEAVVEEESTSWFWYLLIVVMLGAAGFIYWRTKQGRYVDFQSFKKVMNKGNRSAVREEPVVRQAPVAPHAPEAQPAHTVESINHPVREEPRAVREEAPQVTSLKSAPEAPKAEPVDNTNANVFDLVSDDEPLSVPAAQPQPAPQKTDADDHGMKDSLDMARSFISIGAKNEAITLLQEVLQKGSPADKAQAEVLMKQVHERG